MCGAEGTVQIAFGVHFSVHTSKWLCEKNGDRKAVRRQKPASYALVSLPSPCDTHVVAEKGSGWSLWGRFSQPRTRRYPESLLWGAKGRFGSPGLVQFWRRKFLLSKPPQKPTLTQKANNRRFWKGLHLSGRQSFWPLSLVAGEPSAWGGGGYPRLASCVSLAVFSVVVPSLSLPVSGFWGPLL